MPRKNVKKKGGAAASAAGVANENGVITLENGAKLSNRACTGVLASHKGSRDLKIDSFSLSLHGNELITDSKIDFNYGNRYGLIGLNGSGKSTLLKALAEREVPIPDMMNIFFLSEEIEATERTALQAILDSVDKEVARLEAEADRIMEEEGPESDLLQQVYDAIDAMDVATAPKRAGEILFGLGFNKAMQAKMTKDFSGGWRMRIALARALFTRPHLMLLDEPTNHLDTEACVWLEDYLSHYDKILVMISHSQDFLNGVCTHIVHLTQSKLNYYSGNYDTYCKTKGEREENQMKQYEREQEQMAHMKDYVARFGHGSAKLAKQAQSKEKVMAKMVAKGLTEKVHVEHVVPIRFADVGKLPPPVLQFVNVSFGYHPDKPREIYRNVDLGFDLDSRVALVGPNGAGKSTLLKMVAGELQCTEGQIKRHNHLRIGWYRQHLVEVLDLTMTPLAYFMQTFPNIPEEDEARRCIGKFGISGKAQTACMNTLSDGQLSRVVFAILAERKPHMLLLDEPTNHLDIETIDALADAINNWDGGMVLVSHDFRLITQVAKQIFICQNGAVKPWPSDIQGYKKHVRAQLEKLRDS